MVWKLGVASFGLISRNIANNCGISSYAFVPLLYDDSYTFTDLKTNKAWTGLQYLEKKQ